MEYVRNLEIFLFLEFFLKNCFYEFNVKLEVFFKKLVCLVSFGNEVKRILIYISCNVG